MRRHWVIGDSLAPTLAAGFVLVGAVLILLFEKRDEAQFTMAAAQFVFFLKLTIVILVALSVMRHLGPILVNTYAAMSGLDLEYRLLRDVIGIKHIGFLIGGMIMVGGMIAVVEGRLSRRALMIGHQEIKERRKSARYRRGEQLVVHKSLQRFDGQGNARLTE